MCRLFVDAATRRRERCVVLDETIARRLA